MTSDEWYNEGLHFACTQCGDCCTGPPGYVWFDDQEAMAIAGHLGFTVARFLEGYTHQVLGRRSLGERPGDHGYDCVFLERPGDGTARCRIYPVRPVQCRTWPFWPGNLRTVQAWARAQEVCPGCGRGALYAIQQIRILRDRTPDL